MASKAKTIQPAREPAERLPVDGAAWMVVEAGDEVQAAATFVRRYGSHPEHVVDYRGYLWLGPVPGLEGEVQL